MNVKCLTIPNWELKQKGLKQKGFKHTGVD